MKKGFLRCIAVVMVVIMAAVCVPVMDIDSALNISASALTSNNNSMENSNAKWSYDTSNKTLTISGSGNMPNYNDTPKAFSDYNWKLVVTIMNNAKNIVIRDGITSVGNNVFKGFKNVTSVTIPASVTSIGASAFEGCSGITNVKLPANLKTIGANAFKNTKFAAVTMPDSVTSISSNSFSGVSGLKIICNYNTPAYNCLVANSVPFSFPENKLIVDAKLDVAKKQVLVNVKMIYNRAEFNAGNFTLAYNNAVVAPISTETVYKSENGVALATVHHAGKVSFALMAENFVPLSTKSGVSVYDFGTIAFAVNSQGDNADFSFTSDVLMMNNAKTTIKQASGSAGLHSYSERVEKEPTCKVPGTKVNECSVCGKKTETAIPVNPAKHGDTEVVNKKDASCKEAGYTGDTVCKDCGGVVIAGSTVPAGTHDYEAVVTDATCVKGGFTTYTCKACGHSYVGNETEKTAHDYEAVVTAATCTETGFTTYSCKVCADTYKGDFTAELGHDFDENGECSRCDEVSVLSVTFKDNTGITVDDAAKTIIIRKTLKAEELKANIATGNWVVANAEGEALADGTAVATGSLIKAESADVTYTVIIIGDVNRDGRITASDARSVLRVASRLDTGDDIFNLAADCDGKTRITAADARVVLRVASKLQTF